MIRARTVLAAFLLAAGCASASSGASVAFLLPPLEGTTWRAEDIDGARSSDRTPSTVAFEANRRIEGRAACNRYFGTFEQSGETVRIRPAGLTRMACPPAVMDQERQFLVALEAVKRGRREGETLELLDGDGRVRIRLTAIPRQSARHRGAGRRGRSSRTSTRSRTQPPRFAAPRRRDGAPSGPIGMV